MVKPYICGEIPYHVKFLLIRIPEWINTHMPAKKAILWVGLSLFMNMCDPLFFHNTLLRNSNFVVGRI